MKRITDAIAGWLESLARWVRTQGGGGQGEE